MSNITVNGSSPGTALTELLGADDIQPGSDVSYQLCKTIYLYHPLGQKMAESPVAMAQYKPRKVSIPKSPGTHVVDQFNNTWERMGIDKVIFNLGRTARIYGVASVALLVEDLELNQPIPDWFDLPKKKIALNVYDPLNTAGSLVLNQDTTAFDFQKPQKIVVNGKEVNPGRACILMNEEPIYIAFTTSAFGFVGRSVYQRALFPLKSFIQTMITDDVVTIKVGVLVAKIQQAGSIINNMMKAVTGQKREVVKEARVGNVISIGTEEEIESLNFRNMEGPYKTSRENILKNIATAADMPAKLLENETFVEGFGEGTEDAKNIAKYVDRIREWLEPSYFFLTRLVQYMAWTPEFYKTLQTEFPEEYEGKDFKTAFFEWQNSFYAEWPSLLTEEPSKEAEVDKVKLESICKLLDSMKGDLDPVNKAELFKWAADNFNDLKTLFTANLTLDFDAMAEYEPPVPGFGAGAEEQDDEEQEDRADSAFAEIRQALLDLKSAGTVRADSEVVNRLSDKLNAVLLMQRPAAAAPSVNVTSPGVNVEVRNASPDKKVIMKRMDDGTIHAEVFHKDSTMTIPAQPLTNSELTGEVKH